MSVPVTTVRNTIPAASTIAPVDLVHHVSGTGTINNISVPYGGLITGPWQGFLFLVADAACVFGTSGNIANGFTTTAGTAYLCVWEGAKWYIKVNGDFHESIQ